MTKNRCSPVSLVLSIAIGAFLICTVSAQAGGPSAAAGASSNGVTAAVRSIQPAINGLFQLKTPRVWNNGVPGFLDTWDAFQSRTSSASLNKAYAFTTIDGLGHEVLYAGVERASSKSPVVFEFSQLEGKRSVGDLRIEAEIDSAGSIGTVQFQSYSGDGAKAGLKLLPIAILAGEGCNDAGTACVVANGASLEVGANLSQLLNGSEGRFKTVKITTPEDSVVGTFAITANSTDGGCLADVFGSVPNCTANDVTLTAVKPGTCGSINNTCTANNTGTVTLTGCIGQFEITAANRYDIGLFIKTDADAADGTNTEAAKESGLCTRIAWNNDSPLLSLDSDGCGDVNAKGETIELPIPDVTINCVDNNDDGQVDIFHCETWANTADQIGPNQVCRDSRDVRPGVTSKCNCGILAGACIPIPSTVECKENVCLPRCSNNLATPCTFGGTECTDPGFCQDTLVEQGATGGNCGGSPTGDAVCDAQDTCVNGVCTDNRPPEGTTCGDGFACNGDETCQSGSCTDGTDVPCPSLGVCHATSVCVEPAGTCSHVHSLEFTACPGVTVAGDCDAPDSCDAAGNCEDRVLDGTVCRASDGSPCDPPELCDGESKDCPAIDLCAGGTRDPNVPKDICPPVLD